MPHGKELDASNGPVNSSPDSVEFETYIQLTVVEKAFRVLKSELLLRPIWHHYSGRVEAYVMICVLAYALWKTLDHLSKQAQLQTLIHKPDPRNGKAVPPAASDDPRGHSERIGQDQTRGHSPPDFLDDRLVPSGACPVGHSGTDFRGAWGQHSVQGTLFAGAAVGNTQTVIMRAAVRR